MAKKFTESALIGEQGVALIHRLVFEMLASAAAAAADSRRPGRA